VINARIADVDALAGLRPAELSIYLRANGWTLVERTSTAAVWTLSTDDGDDEFEILQPLDPGLRDYALRMADAVRVLAISGRRSELDVLRAVGNVSWDVHTVRIMPADEPAGMIGIDDGIQAVESLRALVAAGAYPVFARQHRAVQPARKPSGFTDFLRGVRIGTATEGSYVLTAHTPVPPRLSADQPPPVDDPGIGLPEAEPVERQVSLRVHQAVRAAHDAATASLLTADGLDPFTSAVDAGVSANLCEALAGLGGISGHPYDLTLSLAAVRPGHIRTEPVRFRRDHLPVLREAAQELRERTPEEDVSVTGHVIRLFREGTAAGEITLAGRVEDQDAFRRIWVTLDDTSYTEAVRAHREMRPVTARGNLIRRGTRLYLAQAIGFRLLPGAEPD
jgi:hypothetical protein